MKQKAQAPAIVIAGIVVIALFFVLYKSFIATPKGNPDAQKPGNSSGGMASGGMRGPSGSGGMMGSGGGMMGSGGGSGSGGVMGSGGR